jgi:catechol 2,3-dioxygenase-like lactoylglutathione lyase family enzyme
MIMRLHHFQITVPRDAEDAAREFYCGFLGLKEIPKAESMKSRGGFWLDFGEMQLHVGIEDIDASGGRENSKVHVAYQVEDLEFWRNKLAANGVKIIESIPMPGYERFEFRDPFGNRVEFLQGIDG